MRAVSELIRVSKSKQRNPIFMRLFEECEVGQDARLGLPVRRQQNAPRGSSRPSSSTSSSSAAASSAAPSERGGDDEAVEDDEDDGECLILKDTDKCIAYWLQDKKKKKLMMMNAIVVEREEHMQQGALPQHLLLLKRIVNETMERDVMLPSGQTSYTPAPGDACSLSKWLKLPRDIGSLSAFACALSAEGLSAEAGYKTGPGLKYMEQIVQFLLHCPARTITAIQAFGLVRAQDIIVYANIALTKVDGAWKVLSHESLNVRLNMNNDSKLEMSQEPGAHAAAAAPAP